MLDRSGTPWVLGIAAAITKNRTGRTLGLEGEVRAVIERRLRARRFDTPLVFNRTCKGKPGQPITDFGDVWRNALQAAGLPPARLFHDLRRSAVRTLIRTGVDETTAMKVSGHKTRSMLLRADGGGKSLTAKVGVGSSGRIRTENQPPTPEDPDPLDPELTPIQRPAVSDHLVPIRTENRDS
jgi:hypothetical protein